MKSIIETLSFFTNRDLKATPEFITGDAADTNLIGDICTALKENEFYEMTIDDKSIEIYFNDGGSTDIKIIVNYDEDYGPVTGEISNDDVDGLTFEVRTDS